MSRLQLNNNRHFPVFSHLPGEYDANFAYYNEKKGVLRPSHHWAFLGEITYDQSIVRPRYIVKDRSGDEVPIAFHHEPFDVMRYNVNPAAFTVGQTIAVFYAENHPFIDMSYGIRVNSLATIKLIPCSLDTLLSANPKNVDALTECSVCHKTGEGATLLRCSKCKTKYCSQTCQKQDWTAHKQTCVALSQVCLWNTRNWDKFNDFWDAF
ncbi:hypothetical protein BDY19DRAFT_995606 [Irpex rosettiformis]|uniref:Uncharacterized protein n=1 Tax=Irpex rosettiformis TaxID=378272 RepID=A0ACB8TXV1_9APHY|nr:hypothetical protein BDY19DRAFT_995606 [Irpex rosettiformis]